MRELLIATGNPGKFNEIAGILEGLPLKFFSLEDLGISGEDFVEDGETFEKNAVKKARYFAGKTSGIMTIGEDSGVFVNALADELGVETRRWGAGESASDEEWLDYFMERMEGESDRGAKFVSFACLYDPVSELEEVSSGEVLGTIADSVLAPVRKGLPLSSVFLREGCEQVYSAMSEAEKNKISHRFAAIQGLAVKLEEVL